MSKAFEDWWERQPKAIDSQCDCLRQYREVVHYAFDGGRSDGIAHAVKVLREEAAKEAHTGGAYPAQLYRAMADRLERGELNMSTVETEWKPITPADPRNGTPVMTRIDDEKGVRNEALLIRKDNLWFYPDMSMYVYYRPTHYRPETDAEIAKRLELERARDAAEFERLKAKLDERQELL